MLVTGQFVDVIAVMLLTLGCQRRIVGVFPYLIDQMILFAPVAFSRLYSSAAQSYFSVVLKNQEENCLYISQKDIAKMAAATQILMNLAPPFMEA